MIKHIHKFKIPRDCAYVTKTSRIEAWSEEEGIVTAIHLDFGALVNNSVFNAHFYLPSFGIPYEHLQIGIAAAKREIVGPIRERIETDVFPALTSWIKQIEALDKTSTAYKNRDFYAQWKNNAIVITKD